MIRACAFHTVQVCCRQAEQIPIQIRSGRLWTHYVHIAYAMGSCTTGQRYELQDCQKFDYSTPIVRHVAFRQNGIPYSITANNLLSKSSILSKTLHFVLIFALLHGFSNSQYLLPLKSKHPLMKYRTFSDQLDTSYIPPGVHGLIHEKILARCMEQPSKEALVSNASVLTFGDLERTSAALSDTLRLNGVRARHNVGFCFEKSVWATIAMLAILRCGACCVPLDPEHPHARVGKIMDAAAIDVVISETQRDWPNELRSFRNILANESLMFPFVNSTCRSETRSGPTESSDVAFILFTSGTTGNPKMVALTHRSICSSAYYHGKSMKVSASTRVYQHAAYIFDMSIYDIFTTLIHGGTVCVPSSYDRIHNICETIQAFASNWAFFTPTLLSSLHPSEVSSLKTIVVSGEMLTQELVHLWADKVCLINGYGSTEMSTCFITPVHMDSDPRKIGFPQGVIACIAGDGHSIDVPSAEAGELIVMGPVLADGYLTSDNNGNAFLRHQPSGHWTYRTGDWVERSSDGSYRIVGRRDTLVKIRGMRVELGEVERCLRGNPQAKHAVVLYPQKGNHQERLTAVIVPSEVSPSDKAFGRLFAEPFLQKALENHVRAALPQYMVPQRWIFLTEMERTATGKIDRNALSRLLGTEERIPGNRCKQLSFVPAAGMNGQAKSRSQNPVLEVAFRDLGLDSINLIGLAKILRKAYQVDVDIGNLSLMSFKKLYQAIDGCSECDKQGRRTQVLSLPKSASADVLMQLVERLIPQRSTTEGILETTVALWPTPTAKQPLNIFITGATGYLGPFLLQELLRVASPSSRITALVRTSSPEKGLQRLKKAFVRSAIQLSPEQCEHLEVWPGDLSQKDLGLTHDQLRRFSEEGGGAIDVVVHSGAVVDWSLPYERLEIPNVVSTLSLLNVMRSSRSCRKMIYVSGGRALEFATSPLSTSLKDVEEDQIGYPTISGLKESLASMDGSGITMNGYDISKVLSEALVLAIPRLIASEPELTPTAVSSINAHVVRPGFIIGNADRGIVDAKDYLWRVVATALRLEMRCDEPTNSWLYIAGAEHVAKCIVGAFNQQSGTELERNITVGVTMDQFWDCVSVIFGLRLVKKPSQEWLESVEKSLESSNWEEHPLSPLLQAHQEDSGRLGLDRAVDGKEWEDSDVKGCLEASLKYLRDQSELFQSWVKP